MQRNAMRTYSRARRQATQPIEYFLATVCEQAPDALPTVLTSRDVIPLVGRNWFMSMLYAGCLPGVQMMAGGVWRCERDTFLSWIQEVAREHASMGIVAGNGTGHAAARRVVAAP
jgi:hypothetical protein